jgi:hypothetical protein
MKGRRDLPNVLRWYPRSWRERYGDEFLAFLEDRVVEQPLTLRCRVAIAWAGLCERVRAGDLSGKRSSPAERVRAGALLVLCAWSAYVVAGASFAKYSEHFDATVPPSLRGLPWGAFRAVQISAVVAAVLVGIAVVVATPAFLEFVRSDGWASVRRHVLRSTAATVVAVAAWAGLVAWANSLTIGQRNGGDIAYELAALICGLLLVAMLALWTTTAVAVGRRLTLTRTALTTEAILAVMLTAAMITMTGATITWWTAMASDAPWFLHGTTVGTHGSPFDTRLGITLVAMTGAILVASYGAIRAIRACTELRAT